MKWYEMIVQVNNIRLILMHDYFGQKLLLILLSRSVKRFIFNGDAASASFSEKLTINHMIEWKSLCTSIHKILKLYKIHTKSLIGCKRFVLIAISVLLRKRYFGH